MTQFLISEDLLKQLVNFLAQNPSVQFIQALQQLPKQEIPVTPPQA